MVNIREDIFKQQIYVLISLWRMFTTFKQLVDTPFNNAHHIRRRIVSLLTNISTTLLQLVNHLNHIKQSQQG